jgi:hypothetical protein
MGRSAPAIAFGLDVRRFEKRGRLQAGVGDGEYDRGERLERQEERGGHTSAAIGSDQP